MACANTRTDGCILACIKIIRNMGMESMCGLTAESMKENGLMECNTGLENRLQVQDILLKAFGRMDQK